MNVFTLNRTILTFVYKSLNQTASRNKYFNFERVPQTSCKLYSTIQYFIFYILWSLGLDTNCLVRWSCTPQRFMPGDAPYSVNTGRTSLFWCSLWLASIATDCTDGIYDGGRSYVESKPFWHIFSMSSIRGRHSSFKTWGASSGWQMVRSGHSSLLWFCIHNFINQDCLGTLKLVIILEVICWRWKQRLK